MRNCLILDIETKTFDNKVDPNKDIFVIAGLYSYKTNKKLITTNLKRIQDMVDSHDVIIGHNFKEYDQIVLERCGIVFKYKTIVDTLVIARKRMKTLMQIDPGSYSLKNLAIVLNLNTLKGDMNFDILQKSIKDWSKDEKDELIKYLVGDIIVTKELFEHFYEYFYEFKQFVNKKNQDNFNWLKCSSGALGYKILCNFANLEEEYNDYEPQKEEVGGLVLTPTGEEFFNVWYMDYSSLYPNIFSMFNLFGHPGLQKSEKWFTGNNVFNVKGKYSMDRQHILSRSYKDLFRNRKKIKKSNPKLAFAYKVILNSGYGVMRSQTFASTYYEHAGGDCCRIGQTMNKLIGEFFEFANFKSVAGDTDSRFLIHNHRLNIERQYGLIESVKNKLLTFIKNYVPFPNDDFDLESETGSLPLKYVKFVKDEHGVFLKKNYIMLTYDDKVFIKGLPIIKSNGSKVGKIILKNYLIPIIKVKGRCCFKEKQVMKWVKEELRKNMKLISVQYRVKPSEYYKVQGCLQAKLSRKFFNGGSGIIDVIKLQTGEYVDVKDTDKYNLFNICYDKIKNEIKPFIKKTQKSLGDFK